MTGLLWVLIIGAVGWVTGKLIGDHGYGTALGSSISDWLDFVIGVAGGSIGGYLLLEAGIWNDGVFSRYATAIVGSVMLVSIARHLSARYFPSTRVK